MPSWDFFNFHIPAVGLGDNVSWWVFASSGRVEMSWFAEIVSFSQSFMYRLLDSSYVHSVVTSVFFHLWSLCSFKAIIMPYLYALFLWLWIDFVLFYIFLVWAVIFVFLWKVLQEEFVFKLPSLDSVLLDCHLAIWTELRYDNEQYLIVHLWSHNCVCSPYLKAAEILWDT